MTTLLISLSLIFFVLSLSARAAVTKIPLYASGIFLLWLVPQVLSVSNLPSSASHVRVGLLFYFSCCLLFLCSGYFYSSVVAKNGGKHSSRIDEIGFNADALDSYPPLKNGAIFLVSFAVLTQVVLLSLPSSLLDQRAPTGIVTIVKFAGEMRSVALAATAILYFQRRDLLSLLLLLVAICCYLPSLLIEVKRAKTVELLFILFGARWFVCKRSINGLLLVPFIALFVIYSAGVAQLRATTGYAGGDGGASELSLLSTEALLSSETIKFGVGNLGSSNLEYRNALAAKYVIDGRGQVGLGSQLWNRLVAMYVPAQLVGYDVKAGLKVGSDLYDNHFLYESGHSKVLGTTYTGMMQAYYDFSYFGALVYGVYGLYLGLLFKKAERGSFSAALLYLGLGSSFMLTLTHDSYRLVVLFPYVLFFVVMFFTVGRLRGGSRFRWPSSA